MGYGSRVAAVAVGLALLPAGCGGAGDGPESPPTPEPTGADRAPGLHERTLATGGQQRDYLLDVPDSYRPGGPVPLVLVLHAGRGTPQKIRSASQMEQFAHGLDLHEVLWEFFTAHARAA